jgi:hypothetical protein
MKRPKSPPTTSDDLFAPSAAPKAPKSRKPSDSSDPSDRWVEGRPPTCLGVRLGSLSLCLSTEDVHDVDILSSAVAGYPEITMRTRLCVLCRPKHKVTHDRGLDVSQK